MRCRCSPSSSQGCDEITRTKTCEPGVSHCLLSLRWHNESNRHVEHIQDCWLWSNDMNGCPDVNGPCYLISKANNKFTTCCCKGDLCNNATDIEIIAPKVVSNNHSFNDDLTPYVELSSPYPSTKASSLHGISEEKYLALLITAPVIITLVFALFLVIILRFCFPRSRAFRFKQVEKHRTNGHKCGTVGLLSNPLNGFPTCTCSQPNKEVVSDKPITRNELYDLNNLGKQPVTGLCWLSDGEYKELSSVIKKVELKAHGRFGQVWQGTYLAPNKGATPDSSSLSKHDIDVAIKIFSAEEKRSWESEVTLFHVPGLNHTNILRYYGADKVPIENSLGTGNCLYEYWLITEYHKLGSLYDYLHNQSVSWLELLNIATGIARGLAHLHSDIPLLTKPSIAHRDLNSRNVLLKSDLTACIADFGLAIRFESGHSCMRDAHLQLGTRRYMAPEVLDGAIQFSRDAYLRIDVYAMGLVFWELMMRCTGSDPENFISNTKYWAPYELELGLQPSMEALQRLVAQSKQRPKFNVLWQSDMGLNALWETVEECWDQDAEARLSAGCVAERLATLHRQFSCATHNPDQTQMSNDTDFDLVKTQPVCDLITTKQTFGMTHSNIPSACSDKLPDIKRNTFDTNDDKSSSSSSSPSLVKKEYRINCNGLSHSFNTYYSVDYSRSNKNKGVDNNNNDDESALYNPELRKLLDHQPC